MVSLISYTQMLLKLITPTQTQLALFWTPDTDHLSTWQDFLDVTITSNSNPQSYCHPNVVSLQHSVSRYRVINCPLPRNWGVILWYVSLSLCNPTLATYPQVWRIFTSQIPLKSVSFLTSPIYHHHGATTVISHLDFNNLLLFVYVGTSCNSSTWARGLFKFSLHPLTNGHTVILIPCIDKFPPSKVPRHMISPMQLALYLAHILW